MKHIVGISGSLRQGSFNTALLRFAASRIQDATIDVRTLHGIPLYDADEEAANGIPESVVSLATAINAADGLLLVTPEYNNSIPGVFKNGIDWLSRVRSIPVFTDKPVGLIGASLSGFGTVLSQAAWLPVLKSLRCRPYSGGAMLISRANTVFNQDGQIEGEQTVAQLDAYLAGFVRCLE